MSARSGFRSALGPHIERFLSHHRSLGKRYDTEESAPRLFDSFLLGRDVDAPVRIAPELIEGLPALPAPYAVRSHNHLLNVLQRLFLGLVAQEVLASSPVRATRSARMG